MKRCKDLTRDIGDKKSDPLVREKEVIDEILNAIHNNRSFLVSSHINPEGDAIGSALALALGLRSMGKEVTVYFEDRIPPRYNFLPFVDQITHKIQDDSFDITFAVDCGDIDRLGEGFKMVKEKGLIINIDHHATNDLFGDINLVCEGASATGEMIYELLKRVDTEITIDIAINLYVALLMDTGSFRYSSATPKSFRIAGELVELGVNPWEISKRIYESYPEKRFRLLGLVLDTLEVRCNGKIALLTVTSEMLRKTSATIDMTENFVNYPRSIENVEVAVLIRERCHGKYKASLRAKGEIDVAAIASLFGGGGHQRAAGCNLEGTLFDIKERLVNAIEKRIGCK